MDDAEIKKTAAFLTDVSEGLYEGDEEVTLRLHLAELMARCVEIEPLIAVLLTVWCAGAPIVKVNGKSRLKQNGIMQTICEP